MQCKKRFTWDFNFNIRASIHSLSRIVSYLPSLEASLENISTMMTLWTAMLERTWSTVFMTFHQFKKTRLNFCI